MAAITYTKDRSKNDFGSYQWYCPSKEGLTHEKSQGKFRIHAPFTNTVCENEDAEENLLRRIIEKEEARPTEFLRLARIWFGHQADLIDYQEISYTGTPDAHLAAKVTSDEIDALGNLTDNWDGSGSLAPTLKTLQAARQWLEVLQPTIVDSKNKVTRKVFQWIEPHVSVNETGSVVFEWVRNNKVLNVYISQDEAFYVKAWGANIVSEMSDGDASAEEMLEVWSWFVGDE